MKIKKTKQFSVCQNQKDFAISVVVCAKNDGRYLEKSLSLLQAQTLRPEIIVVYGESADNTRAVAKKYADIVVKDNGNGLTYARNIGWKAATGDIVAYCDADALPDKIGLQKLHTILQIIQQGFWHFQAPWAQQAEN